MTPDELHALTEDWLAAEDLCALIESKLCAAIQQGQWGGQVQQLAEEASRARSEASARMRKAIAARIEMGRAGWQSAA